MPKDQKDHIPLLLDLIPLVCAALAIVGLVFGTGVVLLGHQADIPLKPRIPATNVSSIFIVRPQSDVLLPELSVGSIAAKAAVNPTLGGTPAHLREVFALNADADSPQFTAPTVSAKRWPVSTTAKGEIELGRRLGGRTWGPSRSTRFALGWRAPVVFGYRTKNGP